MICKQILDAAIQTDITIGAVTRMCPLFPVVGAHHGNHYQDLLPFSHVVEGAEAQEGPEI